mmetsp:Transcript_78186/g.217117  ORF Transcript_78186/g.217117 Transcript_78186/m.217117 type:complete len:251 (+) Transcript_78186:1473-2225(+)
MRWKCPLWIWMAPQPHGLSSPRCGSFQAAQLRASGLPCRPWTEMTDPRSGHAWPSNRRWQTTPFPLRPPRRLLAPSGTNLMSTGTNLRSTDLPKSMAPSPKRPRARFAEAPHWEQHAHTDRAPRDNILTPRAGHPRRRLRRPRRPTPRKSRPGGSAPPCKPYHARPPTCRWRSSGYKSGTQVPSTALGAPNWVQASSAALLPAPAAGKQTTLTSRRHSPTTATRSAHGGSRTGWQGRRCTCLTFLGAASK